MNKSNQSDFQKLEPEIEDLLKELRTEYDAADKLCQEVTEFVDEAGVPSINELRYAGHHLVLFMTNDGGADRANPTELRKAISHCQRASYEAAEAGIITAIGSISDFQEDYPKVNISSVITDWIEILKRCDEIRDEVTKARSQGKNRTGDHKKYMELFRELVGYQRKTKVAREELKKVLSKQKTTIRLSIVAVVVGCAALLATIVFGVIPLL